MDNINNKENYLILNKYLNKDEKILLTFPERNFNKNNRASKHTLTHDIHNFPS